MSDQSFCPMRSRVLGIDELKIIGQYRAMITNVERKTVFDIRPSRAKAELMPYFRDLRDKDSVEWVAMDMYHVYRQVVRATGNPPINQSSEK
ncbi:hypothetical protein ARC78_15895 [Stenotrophomonas pictorum JCM 9942]|uniref:Transposase IS204/IS1001/IS1096/IS1165 DDE domain-containing protein n=1 Tax=Stenotrophomonas pictorum JCM 9942 TaxID=1236960 RepID=A0A0Q9ZY01_9GAMM|nr:hypothetical protein ARC78_15895 [Stenotrophomonas pictorum JCM 9942]